jgi:gentisate 1,2-dioxygenase
LETQVSVEKAIMCDQTGQRRAGRGLDDWRPSDEWPPIIVTRAEIDAEIERLASVSLPDNGRRATLLVHPSAPSPGRGLTPGVQVCLSVLKPGEHTQPVRHNSTQVNFCIRGAGHTVVNGQTIHFQQYDTWNHPSFATYQHFNDTQDLQVRLTYSNAALLEMMRVHIVEELSSVTPNKEPAKDDKPVDSRRRSPYGTFAIGGGAMLMPYETLINPPSVESAALHWPWLSVKEHLDKLSALGEEYIGRRLYLLYNPKTGRSNGTTPNFFATITIRPPNIIDRPHRHVSSAINYYFRGRGYSVVDGKRYEWAAGDLMVSAPGWAVHNHASYDEAVYELTIQDQPLNIEMESLLWQESLKSPPIVLGTSSGFATNRASFAQAEGV